VIRVSVMYPNEKGTTFDMTYYRNRHIPMVRQLLGASLREVSVDQGIASLEPGSPAPYLVVAHLLFDSLQAFQTSVAAHAQTIMSDIPNYTNTQPTIQIGEMKF
jgi:uncharacterized protein (TIGR02118 family)